MGGGPVGGALELKQESACQAEAHRVEERRREDLSQPRAKVAAAIAVRGYDKFQSGLRQCDVETSEGAAHGAE